MNNDKMQLKISALSFAVQFHSVNAESTAEQIVATAESFEKFLTDSNKGGPQ